MEIVSKYKLYAKVIIERRMYQRKC